MVNKALCLFQNGHVDGNMQKAEQVCREAIEKDPDCDVAVATLAQLLLQLNKITEAIGQFHRSGELARTEAELQQAISYESVGNSLAAEHHPQAKTDRSSLCRPPWRNNISYKKTR